MNKTGMILYKNDKNNENHIVLYVVIIKTYTSKNPSFRISIEHISINIITLLKTALEIITIHIKNNKLKNDKTISQ